MTTIDDIKKRLYSTIPVGSLYMNELLSLLSIRLSSTETHSACVTCTNKPELILNPEFIEEYCKTDEHLFMLVMHELYHIILGHTKLYSNHSEIDNIAFDSIINAMLCRIFPQDEYTSFFCNINKADTFPGCILRPKAENSISEVIPLLDNLYNSNTGTYFDTYQTIINYFKNHKLGLYMLLGNHDNKKINDPKLVNVIERIVEKWPRPPKPISGRDLGEKSKTENILLNQNIDKRKKIIKFLRQASIIVGKHENLKRDYENIETSIMTFVPNYKDRMLYAKKKIYDYVLTYNDFTKINSYSSLSHTSTYVYLDVSGSVIDDLKTFMPLLLKPYKNKECLIYTFSTEVYPTNPKDFIDGKVKTTGGTDINCIFDYYFSLPKRKRPKKIVILTDGYTGACNEYYLNMIKKDGIKIYVGLFGVYKSKNDLENIATRMEEF